MFSVRKIVGPHRFFYLFSHKRKRFEITFKNCAFQGDIIEMIPLLQDGILDLEFYKIIDEKNEEKEFLRKYRLEREPVRLVRLI
ncbi:MAG: hypothetical protein AB1643_02140 [Patescibacteria group bacterium]